MITFVRTVSIAPGRTGEVLALARKIKDYIRQQYGLELGLSMPIGGDPNRLAFIAVTPSLADFEALTNKLANDAEYQQLVVTNAANIIPASVHDELWRAIEDPAKPAAPQ